MLRHVSFLLFLGVLSVALASKTNYYRYRLVKIQPRTDEHINLLTQWQHDPEFDIWNRIKGVDIGVDVLLSPTAFMKYKILFEQNNIQFKILESNIQAKIDEEAFSMARMKMSGNESRVVNTYARHPQIITWMEMIAAANPSYASTYSAGTTLESRDLRVIKLKTATTQRSIWIDCGIHAREWISPATCINFIDKIIRDYNNGEPVAKEILDYYEIHIMPVHNPDGYEYTTTTRLWRKNRKRNTGSACLGVDLNRNYGYKWLVAGASTNPCSDTYAGPSANSELETQAVQKVINDKKGDWDAFITIHSYGQWFFTPWCWTTAYPADYNEQLRVAQLSSNAIKSVYGSTFTSGPSGVLLYLGAGCSSDWGYGDANIKYSYTIELRPSDTSVDASYGFLLPVDRAPAVGEEIYQGLRAFFKAIKP